MGYANTPGPIYWAQEQAGDPANIADTGIIYTKDVAGVTELFYEDDAGNVTQITGGGTLTHSLQEAYNDGQQIDTTALAAMVSIIGAQSGLFMSEVAADPSGGPGAGNGTIWVRDDAPNVLVFTDDAGTDWVLGGTPAGNTLDMAYDEGGAGSGRTITADSDAVVINNAVADGTNTLELTRTLATGNAYCVNMAVDGTDNSLGWHIDAQGTNQTESKTLCLVDYQANAINDAGDTRIIDIQMTEAVACTGGILNGIRVRADPFTASTAQVCQIYAESNGSLTGAADHMLLHAVDTGTINNAGATTYGALIDLSGMTLTAGSVEGVYSTVPANGRAGYYTDSAYIVEICNSSEALNVTGDCAINGDVIMTSTKQVQLGGPGRYLTDDGSDIELVTDSNIDMTLSDNGGASHLRVYDNTPAQIFDMDSNGVITAYNSLLPNTTSSQQIGGATNIWADLYVELGRFYDNTGAEASHIYRTLTEWVFEAAGAGGVADIEFVLGDADGTSTFEIQDSGNNPVIAVDSHGTTTWGSSASCTLATGGEDSPDVNQGGICLNQGGADGNILSMKSSDCAMPFTGVMEADTYAQFRKVNADEGGLAIFAGSEGNNEALKMFCWQQTGGTSESEAALVITCAESNGGIGTQAMGDDDVLMSLYNSDTLVMHIEGDGDTHIAGSVVLPANVTGILTGGNTSAPTKFGINETPGSGSIHLDGDTGEIACITIRNPDVAHGMTSYADTDVAGSVAQDGASGALRIVGFSESTNALWGIGCAATVDTTEAAGSAGAVRFSGYVQSGTGITTMAADDNVFVVRNAAGTKFIIKGDGDLYIDGTYENFDIEDDIQLLQDLNNHLGTNAKSPSDARVKKLRDKKFIGMKPTKSTAEDPETHEMMSMKKTKALHIGATIQLYKMLKGVAKELGMTETQLKALAQEISEEV